MPIEELSKREYKSYEIKVKYSTKFYFDVSIKEKKHSNVINLKRKKFFFKQERAFDFRLFENYIEVSDCFGIFDRKKLVAVIEGELQEWHNRYRIWNLWVHPKKRNQGLASELLAYIETVAKKKHARALILETQSCNYPAISLYRKHGFYLVGLDKESYSNSDIKDKNVRLEFGKQII